jgi:hypothetical protein
MYRQLSKIKVPLRLSYSAKKITDLRLLDSGN